MSAEPPVEAPARAERREPSLVVLHTGDGKGKTTAAMGIAMRAAGHGERVAVVQFMKSGRWKSGERLAAEQLGVDWSVIGDGFTWDSDDLERAAEIAREAWTEAATRIAEGAYDVVVLDEVTYPLAWGWVPTAEVVAAIGARPGARVGRADRPRCARRAPRDRRHGEREHEREARVRRRRRGAEGDRLLDGDDAVARRRRKRQVARGRGARRADGSTGDRDRDGRGPRRRDVGADRAASRVNGPRPGPCSKSRSTCSRAVEHAEGATIVDCLTLWVSNLLGADVADDEIVARAEAAAKACAARSEPTIVVSNEVGSGIVPMHPVSRRYRDVLGRVNAIFADEAATVALMVAGRAMRLSTKLTDLEEPS